MAENKKLIKDSHEFNVKSATHFSANTSYTETIKLLYKVMEYEVSYYHHMLEVYQFLDKLEEKLREISDNPRYDFQI